LSLHPGHVEWEQSAVLDHLPRDLVLARRELTEWNFLAMADAVNQRKIRRSQQSQVLAVLFVNPLNVFSDHHPDSSTHFGIWRLLAAGSFSSTLAAHCTDKSSALHLAAPDRRYTSALQAEIRNLTQRL